MNCQDYWKDLLHTKNVNEEKDLPIWKWSVFDNPEETRRKMNCIQSILENAFESNENGPFVGVLFLIHCALKVRLDLLWSDNVESFRERVFPIAWNQDRWSSLISYGEKILNRPPLLEDADVRQKYIARVKVEAGLPLNSLCKEASGFFNGMKRIWNRMGLADSVLQRWGEEEFSQNQGNAFAGGIGAGLAFFQYATEILRDVDTCHERTREAISQILVNRHHFKGPLDRFEKFLEDNNENETEINWRKLLKIRRVLLLGNVLKLVTNYSILGGYRKSGVSLLTLTAPGEDDITWNYDGNGFLRPGRPNVGYYADASKGISIDICDIDGHHIKQEILDELSDDIIYFKPLLDQDGKLIRGYFETTALPRDIRNIEFPLAVAIPESDNTIDYSVLKEFFKGSLSAHYSYNVYLINSFDEFNRCGLRRAVLKLRMDPLLQQVKVSLNGENIRNQSLGYPHSPAVSLPLYYKDADQWKRVSWNSRLSNIELRTFKLGDDSDTPTTDAAVFPLNFHYKFKYSSDSRCYTGLELYNGDSRIDINELRIDKEKASAELWKSLKHESDIQCDVKINDGNILTLHLPSPFPGTSWMFPSLPNKKEIWGQTWPLISLRDVPDVRLCYVFDSSNRPNSLHWIISMYDESNLILQRDEFVPASLLNCQQENVVAKLPNYLEKFFSATNSLMAEIRVEAHVLLEGEDYRASDTKRSAKLVISRFDEGEINEHASYFYFGIYNPAEHCSHALNEIPSEIELSEDRWIKVPAEALPDGRLEWDGIHRIRPLHNEKGRVIKTDNLSPLQKCLISNNYTETKNQLKEYFVNDSLSDEDKNFIDGYITFCITHRIPLCNLWLLQVVLECDWIACQIPSISKLLKMSSYKFAFDVRLLRPEIIAKYNSDGALHGVLNNLLESSNSEIFLGTTSFKPYEKNGDEISGLCKCDLWSTVRGTFANLGKNYENFFFNKKSQRWQSVEPWEKTICYIVHNVILTPEGDDTRNRQHYTNAMLCLRFLESIDENAVSVLLNEIVQWKYSKRRVYAFKNGAKTRAAELGFEISEFRDVESLIGLSENESKNNGCQYAESIKRELDKKEKWKQFLLECGIKENDLENDICEWQDEYATKDANELQESAKQIAYRINPHQEECWKYILRKRGLSEQQIASSRFSYKSYHRFYSFEQLEQEALRLIEGV